MLNCLQSEHKLSAKHPMNPMKESDWDKYKIYLIRNISSAVTQHSRYPYGLLLKFTYTHYSIKEIKDFVFPLLNSILPSYNLTDKYALAKHASQGNTLYHHFWAAIYRSSKENKSSDVQLFWRIDPTRFSFGLYFGFDVGKELLQECQANIDRNNKKILSLFKSINSPRKFNTGRE